MAHDDQSNVDSFQQFVKIGLIVCGTLIALLLGDTCVAQIVAPNATFQTGHCYRLDPRPAWLSLAGNRNVEIPCP